MSKIFYLEQYIDEPISTELSNPLLILITLCHYENIKLSLYNVPNEGQITSGCG